MDALNFELKTFLKEIRNNHHLRFYYYPETKESFVESVTKVETKYGAIECDMITKINVRFNARVPEDCEIRRDGKITFNLSDRQYHTFVSALTLLSKVKDGSLNIDYWVNNSSSMFKKYGIKRESLIIKIDSPKKGCTNELSIDNVYDSHYGMMLTRHIDYLDVKTTYNLNEEKVY